MASDTRIRTEPVSEREAIITEQAPPRWRPDLLGMLAVIGVTLLLGYRLLGPKISAPADILYEFHPFDAIGQQPLRNWILHDVVQVIYPNRIFVNTQLQAGRFPLWNPYVGMGTPAAADPVMALFYPTTVALGWLSAARALNIEILIHLFIAAMGMYTLVRVWGGKPAGAVAAAAAFAGCSTLTVWQQYGNIFTCGSWLPWLAVCFVLAQRGRPVLWVGAGGLVLGLIVLANDVQWLLYDLLFLGCYALWLAIAAVRKRKIDPVLKPLLTSGAIVALGFGIGAVQFLPELELASNSPRTSGIAPYAWVLARASPHERLLSLIAPNFFGTPNLIGSEWLTNDKYPETIVFWGLFPLLLALTALIWRRDRTTWFLSAFLLFAASMVFGTPVLHLYAMLPGFQLLEVSRLGYLMCFVGAALCGLALDALFADRRAWRPLAVIGGLALAARGTLHGALLHDRPRLPQSANYLQPTQASIHWMTIVALAGVVILAAAMLLRGSQARSIAAGFFVLLIILDIAHFSLPYNAQQVDENRLYPRPQIFASIPPSVAPPRVVPINKKDDELLLPPNMLEAFGYADIGAYASLLTTASNAYLRTMDPLPFQYNGYVLTITQYQSPLIDLAGGQYFISSFPLDPAKRPSLQPIAVGDNVTLYQNPQVAPRAFIVGNVKAVPDGITSLQTLATSNYAPCAFATAEIPPVLAIANPHPSCTGTATITKYEANRVQIQAETAAAGMLVLTDAYYPDWQVKVDGVVQTVYRADGAFRGVILQPGAHDVTFEFRPTRVILGGIISFVSLLIALLLIAAGRKQFPLS